MVEITLIGSVMSPMIKKMLDKIPSYITGQYHWQRNMEKDLRKLQGALLRIQVVVDEAEEWQTVKHNQKLLLQRLEDAVNEADDLLYEFEYWGMEARALEAQGIVSRTVSSFKKYSKRMIGLEKLPSKLKEILETLDSVDEEAKQLIKVKGIEKKRATEQANVEPNCATRSIPATEILGRDKEKDEIVTLLKQVDEAESSNRNVPIITILGEGGVGKTTLAQYVVGDTEVEKHFNKKMWVCASTFDKIRLTMMMLESASGKHEDFINFDTLSKHLEATLEPIKFLLVLDDVCYDEELSRWENEHRWVDLLIPLRAGKRGSKILVTTRDRKAADMFGPRNRYDLNGLPDDECWQLIARCAFDNRNPDDFPELQEIGMQIVKGLSGLPLAAEIVGGSLKHIVDVDEWKTILDRLELGNISAYRLVYDRLPKKLQPCFAYCSIFPKGWRFDSNKLVRYWIAQDYIQPKNGEERKMEDVGKDYFNDLLSKFFFQKLGEGSSKYYLMHDLLHDLAVSVSSDQCFQFEGHRQKTIPQNVQHLGVVISTAHEYRDFIARLKKMLNLKKLRTLIFFKGSYFPTVPSLFKEFRSLRVLELGELKLKEFSAGLGHMRHLRYLDIGGNGFENLPKSSRELYNLEVLASFWKLPLCKSIMQLIEFGKLACLDVPRLEFQVEKKRGHTIGVLKDMVVGLEGVLCIKNLENVTRKEEAIEADLGSKKDVYGLKLQWGSSGRIKRHDAFEEVAEALKPHQNLKWLGIDGFRGIRSPSWLERKWLENLKSISLCNCECVEVLPSLGHLPVLKALIIIGMPALKKVGREFYGVDSSCGVRGFPSLEYLSFENMPEWLEWCDVEFPVFPCLRSLHVLQSPKLMRFPRFPPALRHIDIYNTGCISSISTGRPGPDCFDLKSSIIPSRALLHDQLIVCIGWLGIAECKEPMPAGGIVELAPLKNLQISRCQELLASRILDEEKEMDGTSVLPSSLISLDIDECRVTDWWLSRCLQGLTALSVLQLQKCKELTSLGGLHALTSLRYLSLIDCPELRSLPEEALPASLEGVTFVGCGVPKESLVRCLQGLTSLSRLTVDFWTDLTSLPYLRFLRVEKCSFEADSEVQLPQSLYLLQIYECGVSDTSLSICLRGLTSLPRLSIYSCNHLTSLPSAQVLHRLTALEELFLNCNELRSLGGLHALPSLKTLEIINCDPALMQQIREKKGPEWNKVAHIPKVDVL